MTKHYRLKDGTIIKEIQKGAWSIIFPNKRYVIVTTWSGKVEMDIPGVGIIPLGEIFQLHQNERGK